MKKGTFLLATLGILFLASTSLAQEAYKVIVHSSNSTSSMTSEQVSRLFLKKDTKWNDGRRVQPVDLSPRSSVRARFSQEIHRKSVNAVKAYWHRMVFSGGDGPPQEKASIREVVDFVGSNAGAVGYVPSSAAVGNCKVLSVQ